MASFAERLLASAVRDGGLGRADRLVVAASGGVDSTVLLRTLAGAGWPVVAVHVHHGLRPEADADADFVVSLGAELGVEAEVVRVSVGEGNVQAEARAARYDALHEAARRRGAPAVLTAHTATDQAETVVMNLVRGTGLRGLGGMAPRRPIARGADVALVRPLLWASRREVEAEALRRGWRWRADASNASGAFLRNRVRLDVLPLLEAEGGSEVDLRIARAAAAARAALAGPAPLAVLDAHGEATEGGGRLGAGEVAGLPEAVRLGVWAEAVRRWAPGAAVSEPTLSRIDALLDAPAGRRVEAGGLAVWRERDALAFGTAPEAHRPVPQTIAPAAGAWTVRTEGGVVRSRWGAPAAAGPEAVAVDPQRLPDALTVRPWADGDRIRPVGLDGSKLVSDLLRERGVPAPERRRVLVAEGGGEILWVVGHRVSRAVAASASAPRVLWWSWAPAGGEG